MAEKDYHRGEQNKGVTPIQDMSTRQLRMYIRERADEANKRISTIRDIEDTPQALQDQLFMLQSFGRGRSGGVIKDTSRMDKVDMVEYAYALRDFNMLDTSSKYSRDQDYRQNRKKYETFVKKQWDSIDQEAKKYWSQFKTEKGNVSKKGYQEYKNFVNFLKSIDHTISTYGYETIAGQYYDQTGEVELSREEVEQIALDVFQENSGKGLETKDITRILLDRLDEKRNPKKEEEAPEPEFKDRVRSKKGKGTRKKGTKSSQNIGTKTGGKMKNGRVREKQGLSKR
jgi:uncharacterized protein (UPF0335 family)